MRTQQGDVIEKKNPVDLSGSGKQWIDGCDFDVGHIVAINMNIVPLKWKVYLKEL